MSGHTNYCPSVLDTVGWVVNAKMPARMSNGAVQFCGSSV